MEYLDFNYKAARAQAALFPDGRREAQAYIYPTAKRADAASQIRSLADAAMKLATDLRMQPAFMRWLLSDPANQMQYLPKENVCATAAIGQPPLDGSKATLLMIMEQGADYTHKGDGMWLDSHGRLWAGDDGAAAYADSCTMMADGLMRLSDAITRCGGSLKDNCLRTWIFVRDIDNNYTGVVAARNKVFQSEGLTPHTHFIASTGIEGSSAEAARLVALNAFADMSVMPRQISHLHGKSHLNPTYEYGVAFERATAVDYSDRRHVYVSGTASIDNKGRIVAPGDIEAQTERMLLNIEVLLKEGECGWSDVAHMTVYLRDMADFPTVRDIFERRFPDIPKAMVVAPVCRPGWLIETECMAIKKILRPEFPPY